MNWRVRQGSAADAPACHAVYVDAVHNGTAPHYSREEALAWAPAGETGDWMAPRLQAGITWIAETGSRAEGFLTVTPQGHLDLFFVRPEHRGSGLAADLHGRMIGWARGRPIDRMTTFASHLARRFLERRGWRVVEAETNLRNGVLLDRWKMQLDLPAHD